MLEATGRVMAALRAHRAGLRCPPLTAPQYHDRERAGLEKTARALRGQRGDL
jgi:hypothetical protein